MLTHTITCMHVQRTSYRIQFSTETMDGGFGSSAGSASTRCYLIKVSGYLLLPRAYSPIHTVISYLSVALTLFPVRSLGSSEDRGRVSEPLPRLTFKSKVKMILCDDGRAWGKEEGGSTCERKNMAHRRTASEEGR